MTVLRYGLQFQQLPAYLPIQAQPLLVMSRLKQYFPLFNRGTESNEITQYASTTWHDGITEHQVLLFQYHYISNRFTDLFGDFCSTDCMGRFHPQQYYPIFQYHQTRLV